VEEQRCHGTRKDGRPCRVAFGLSADGLCLTHDPARAEVLAAARQARTAASHAKRQENRDKVPHGMPRRRPRTLDDVVQWASWALIAAATGVIDARLAHEIAVLCTTFRGALEKREYVREIKELRTRLASLQTPEDRARLR